MIFPTFRRTFGKGSIRSIRERRSLPAKTGGIGGSLMTCISALP